MRALLSSAEPGHVADDKLALRFLFDGDRLVQQPDLAEVAFKVGQISPSLSETPSTKAVTHSWVEQSVITSSSFPCTSQTQPRRSLPR